MDPNQTGEFKTLRANGLDLDAFHCYMCRWSGVVDDLGEEIGNDVNFCPKCGTEIIINT